MASAGVVLAETVGLKNSHLSSWGHTRHTRHAGHRSTNTQVTGPTHGPFRNPGVPMWRQMTRSIWDEANAQPGLLSCGPQGADHRKPSFSRQSRVTAQESRDWHQKNAAWASRSVWSISVSEIVEATLRAVDDADATLDPGQKRALGHAYADYRGLTKGEMKDARGNLLRSMIARGEQQTTDGGFAGEAA